ncbi:hypothetical protein D3C72_2107900 [compost metagenome]
MKYHEACKHRRKNGQAKGQGGVDPDPAVDLARFPGGHALQMVEFVKQPATLDEIAAPAFRETHAACRAHDQHSAEAPLELADLFTD